MFFLDTQSCMYFLKGRSTKLKTKILNTPPGLIKIPSIVKGELLYSAEKSQNPEENRKKAEQFLFPFEVKGFYNEQSEIYGRLRASLEKSGEPLKDNLLIIAAIVMAEKGTLVTHNSLYYKIKDLDLVDWFY